MWYIAAVPHLHHTLTLGKKPRFVVYERKRPSIRGDLEPLSRLHELGLAPLVKEVRAEQWGGNRWFVPQAFSSRDLGYFSALTNVRTLRIQRMEIHRFVLDIEHYFGQLSPRLRSIKLFYPRCTPLQLSHFLSFFPSLDDIEIMGVDRHIPDPTIPVRSSSNSPHRNPGGNCCFIASIGSRLGPISSIRMVACGSVTWTCAGVKAVYRSCSRRVVRLWRR